MKINMTVTKAYRDITIAGIREILKRHYQIENEACINEITNAIILERCMIFDMIKTMLDIQYIQGSNIIPFSKSNN